MSITVRNLQTRIVYVISYNLIVAKCRSCNRLDNLVLMERYLSDHYMDSRRICQSCIPTNNEYRELEYKI